VTAAASERLPIAATEEERPTIAEVERFLARRRTSPARLVGPDDEAIELPESAFVLLKDVVHQLAQGNAVAIVPVHMELTTQEAANLLNVSRQYLVRLLEDGAIPFTRLGTHRRIRFGDLMKYKQARDAKRREGLKRLTQLSEELGLYDE
jgi:excisionase family DNA binding protein